MWLYRVYSQKRGRRVITVHVPSSHIVFQCSDTFERIYHNYVNPSYYLDGYIQWEDNDDRTRQTSSTDR